MNKNPMPQGVERITLGTFKLHETSLDRIENTVELSEKNFRMLVSLIPKIDTHNAMNNELQKTKDLCTTLQMKSDLKRQDIIDMLTSRIEYTQFMQDLAEFRKINIVVVGKIDLSKFNTGTPNEI